MGGGGYFGKLLLQGRFFYDILFLDKYNPHYGSISTIKKGLLNYGKLNFYKNRYG
jgi:hypothetical protein